MRARVRACVRACVRERLTSDRDHPDEHVGESGDPEDGHKQRDDVEAAGAARLARVGDGAEETGGQR